MPTPIELPTKKADLKETISQMVYEGLSEMAPHRVRYLVNHYYLQGIRRFGTLDYTNGTVQIARQDHHGHMDFKYEGITKKYEDELGRRSGVDVRPKVNRPGNLSLDSLRQASMAQAVLDTLTSELDLNAIKSQAFEVQLRAGRGALALWSQDTAFIEAQEQRTHIGIEVIPPWQLIPLPARYTSTNDMRGVGRVRKVPVSWLKTRNGLKANWNEIDTVDVSPAVDPNNIDDTTYGTSMRQQRRRSRSTQDHAVPHCLLAELFFEDSNGTVLRYVVWAGDEILLDEDYAKTPMKQRPMMPIAVFDDIPTGEFYSKCFLDKLVGLNVETEYLLKNTFENFQEISIFGTMVFPTTLGINKQEFLNPRTKPRCVSYEPSYVSKEHRPFNIAPFNIGDAPGRFASFSIGAMDQLAGHSSGMFSGDAPGRVDSASGLSFLYETSNIPLRGPMTSIKSAFVKIYKAMLSVARATWQKGELAQITMLDDNILGVVIDPETGQLALDANSVPHPSSVDITIQSDRPVSLSQKKQELKEMLSLGLVSPYEFKIMNFKEGFDLPMLPDGEWESYRKAVIQNVILFNDGVTPGKWTGQSGQSELIISENSDDPIIQLRVIGDFIKKPEFMLASPAVRNAFYKRKSEYEAMAGTTYPEQLPFMDEMVQEKMAQQSLTEGPAQSEVQQQARAAGALGR
jgi:hypothetical protein